MRFSCSILRRLLTHYQTTNFRLFQIKKLCRRQFKIWRKWQKVIQTGRKHCEKRRNCSLRAISPFPTVFQKACFPGASKGVIVWEWVKHVWEQVSGYGKTVVSVLVWESSWKTYLRHWPPCHKQANKKKKRHFKGIQLLKAKPYGLADQKLCCFQIDKIFENKKICSWKLLVNKVLGFTGAM